MTATKCEECKFWSEEPANDYSKRSFRLGRCHLAGMFWDATEWDTKSSTRILRPEFSKAKMFVQDGSDYYAELLTTPDFGCVSFEKRTEENEAS